MLEQKAELIHVFPRWETDHITSFYEEFGPCWCGAMPDPEEPLVIVHNAGRVC